MWLIDRVQIQGLGPFKDAELVVKQGQVTVILGENQTDKDQQSNGSGKSFILEALYFGLTGNSIRAVTNKELVNYTCDSAQVVIRLENGTERLIVTRSISKSGKASLSLVKDGKEQVIVSQQEGNDYIKEWMGVTLEEFQNYYLVSKGKYQSFFSSSDKQKKELIMRLSNASVIDNAMASIKEDKAICVEKAQEYSIKLDNIDTDIRRLEDNISDLKQDSIETEKLEYTTKIDGFKKEIINTKEGIEADKARAVVFQSEIQPLQEKANVELGSLDAYQENLDKVISLLSANKAAKSNAEGDLASCDIKPQLRNMDAEVASIKRNREEYSKALDNLITCPSCSHQFPLGISKEELEAKIAECDSTIKTISDKAVTLTQENAKKQGALLEEINKLKAGTAKLEDSKVKMQGLLAQQEEAHKAVRDARFLIEEKTKQVAGLDLAIKRKENDLNSLRESIEKLESQMNSLQANKHAKRIAELDIEINKVKANKAKLLDLKERATSMDIKLSNLDSSFIDFKNVVCNRSVLLIEDATNKLLSGVSDLSLDLSGYRTSSAGKVIEKITPYIIRRGERVAFASLSQGERTRVEITTLVAIQSIIGGTGKGLDFLMMDELAESADEVGFIKIVDSLQSLGKTCYIINHSGAEVSFPNTLKVIKDGHAKLLGT